MIKGIFASAGTLVLLATLGGCDKADGFADVAPPSTAHTVVPVKAPTASPSKPVLASLASIDSLKAANDRAAQEKAAAVNACLARVHQGDAYKALDKQATDLRAAIAMDKNQNQSAKINSDWAKLLPILAQINRLECDAVDEDPIARTAALKAASASMAYASALSNQSETQKQARATGEEVVQTASTLMPAASTPGSQPPAYATPSVGSGGYYGASASKSVHVNGYTRRDGTYVAPHYRSAPGHGSGHR